MSAPLGIKAAANPEATTGAADPEQLADARGNAPLTVLTLDRAVSLRDYEDFTRAFIGVAKALATWTWDGRQRRVLITISGPDGAEIPETSATFKNLVAALSAAGDPFVSFSVKSFRPATFRLVARLKVDEPVHVRAVVHTAVEAALREHFSFTERAFTQPVMLSEVIAVIHAVDGVIAVDVDKLYRGASPTLQPRLPADQPHIDANGVLQAAELLTLDPGLLPLEVML
jgi:predicted phage baseplate assembly protein